MKIINAKIDFILMGIMHQLLIETASRLPIDDISPDDIEWIIRHGGPQGACLSLGKIGNVERTDIIIMYDDDRKFRCYVSPTDCPDWMENMMEGNLYDDHNLRMIIDWATNLVLEYAGINGA